MNPIHPQRTASSTFDLIQVAGRRGHEVLIVHPSGISLHPDGLVHAIARPVTVLNTIDYGPVKLLNLSECDALLMRLQPPFDIDYFTTCRMLEWVESSLIPINRPSAILNYPEKLFMMRFPDIHPPTVISSDPEVLTEFRNHHGDVIVKPLYDFQGSGVFYVSREDKNLDSIVVTLTQLYRTAIVVQKYIPAVREGDKRIFLLDGIPVGAINRLPESSSARANLHAGGKAETTTLSARDKAICSRIGPSLAKLGLVLVGVDVIGEWITEISTTSPTGIVPIRQLTGIDISEALWEWVESRKQANIN
jgi:glutathione synthase